MSWLPSFRSRGARGSVHSWVSRKRGTRLAVDHLMRETLQAVLEGDGAAAEGLLAKVVQKDSSAIDAYVALARLLRDRGEVERAVRIHQNLLLRPDLERGERIEALVEVGRDYARGGVPERAIAAFEEALAEDSRNQGALRELSELAEGRGDFQRALTLRKRLVRSGREGDASGEARLWIGHGEALLATGKLKDARRAARRALRQDAANASALLLLGRVEGARERTKAALAAFRQLPAADPELFAKAALRQEVSAAFRRAGQEEAYETLLREQLGTDQSEALRQALVESLEARGADEAARSEVETWTQDRPQSLAAQIAWGRLTLGPPSAESGSAAGTPVAEALGGLLELLTQVEEDAS